MAAKREKSKTPKPPPPAAIADDPTAEEPQRDKRLRQNLPPPVCPYHKVECRANHSDPLFTRYYCPTEGCSYSQKVPRPQIDAILRRREEREGGFSAR